MNRRRFLASTLAASLTAPSLRAWDGGANSRFCPQDWRQFQITTRVALPDAPGPAQLWVPLAQTAGDYQIASNPRLDDPNRARPVYDAYYGAPIMQGSWAKEEPASRTLEINQWVAVRDRPTASGQMLSLTEGERKFWTAPTASVPLDGAVLAASAKITAGKATPRDRLRAIYDWIIDHTHRDPDVPGCGRGDLKEMLEKGQLSGKCADINGLLVGLARGAGFPARDVYGIRVAPSRLYPSLGSGIDISRAQHCRAEVFLDGEGWFPVDPADVRKVILAEKLALDSPQVRVLRVQLFGAWEMNWIGFNSATDIVLPGIGERKPDFSFLMYPCAFTSAGECLRTDPAKFRYEITSRTVPFG